MHNIHVVVPPVISIICLQVTFTAKLQAPLAAQQQEGPCHLLFLCKSITVAANTHCKSLLVSSKAVLLELPDSCKSS